MEVKPSTVPIWVNYFRGNFTVVIHHEYKWVRLKQIKYRPDGTEDSRGIAGGADYTFECIGNPQVMRQAFECARPGWGTCVILGLEPGTQEMSFRPVMVRYGRVIKGSYFGGIKGRTQLPRLVDW